MSNTYEEMSFEDLLTELRNFETLRKEVFHLYSKGQIDKEDGESEIELLNEIIMEITHAMVNRRMKDCLKNFHKNNE